MTYEDIIISREDGHIALLTLNRPDRLNAISQNLHAELVAATNELRCDDGVRAVVITGAGKGFCAGADLWQPSLAGGGPGRADQLDDLYWMGRQAIAMAALDKPVIAAVNGVAAGAGLALAVSSDIRIASDTARFTSVFIRRALAPDAGLSYLLPRLIGWAKATEFLMLGHIIDAAEAERIGLVSRVVPATELLDNALALARELAALPPIAMQLTKRLLLRSMEADFLPHLKTEGNAVRINLATEDHAESKRAFSEKRDPHFQGR